MFKMLNLLNSCIKFLFIIMQIQIQCKIKSAGYTMTIHVEITSKLFTKYSGHEPPNNARF